jgi:CRISPR/Cas system-associated exonuclease Cas4 (RecB family)
VAQEEIEVLEARRKLKKYGMREGKQIKEMIREERFPAPPAQRGKCLDCEYQNYCRDIW